MLLHTDCVTGKLQRFVFRDDQMTLGWDARGKHFPSVVIECGWKIQQLAAA